MYTLDKNLPAEVKLDVYKRAIDIYNAVLIDSDYRPFDLDINGGIGLCLLLPCLLWNLDHYLDDMPDGEVWNLSGTPRAFPEIKPFIRTIPNSKGTEVAIRYRIEILEKCIESIENNLILSHDSKQ